MKLDNYNKEIEILNDMHEIYSLLYIIQNKIQVNADAKLDNITSTQLMLFIAIAHLPVEEATIVNIANSLGTSKQNVTRLTNSMIKNGYLTSTPGKKDKRTVNIELTQKGKGVMEQNTIKSNEYFLNLFHVLSKDELKNLRYFIRKII